MRAFFCLVVFLTFCNAALAQEDLTRRDRAAILYSTRFRFTREHVPIINVLVMDGQDRVVFWADDGIVFRPEGEGGPEISVGAGRTRCEARIENARPARLKYWVALDKVSARDLERLRKVREQWEAGGFRVRTFERGSVFGFYGRVFDNRTIVIVEDQGFESKKAAASRREKLAREKGIATLDVFEELVEMPGGVIRVRCEGAAVDLAFPEVVFVGAQAGAPGFIHVKGVEFGRGFPWHGREDRAYRGEIVLTPDKDGKLAVINAVDAETLLKGLVPSEIYVDAPMEALKAQAVCARGEMFAKLGTGHTADPYMICSDVHCQVYRGAARENPRTDKAVEETKGLMLFYGDALADTVYSACCGGHTEDGEKVWQGSGHKYLKGVVDGPKGVRVFEGGLNEAEVRKFIEAPPAGLYCGESRYGKGSFRWEKTVSKEEIRKGVAEIFGIDVGEVMAIEPLERGVSGRIVRLRVVGSAGVAELSPELGIRKALGNLKSSLFIVEPAENKNGFRFRGGGFGHGVGMCQVGATRLAEKGEKFESILKHYFPDTVLVRIY